MNESDFKKFALANLPNGLPFSIDLVIPLIPAITQLVNDKVSVQINNGKEVNYALIKQEINILVANTRITLAQNNENLGHTNHKEDEKKIVEDIGRVLLTSIYLQTIQNSELSHSGKHITATLLKGLLETIELIDNEPLISNQDKLIARLTIDEEKYRKELAEPLEIIPSDRILVRSQNVYFKSNLKHRQENILIQELKEQGYTDKPKQIISLFKGDNNANIEIKKGMLHHISYLLHQLINARPPFIEIVGGKGFFKHFENVLSHRDTIMGQNGMAELKRQVDSTKYSKSHVRVDVQKIIDKLKSS